MKGLKEENAGVWTAFRDPIDIGIPSAVVFLIKKGIGFVFSSKPPTSTLLALSSINWEDWLISNRFFTTTSGARDFVVIVLKEMELIRF